MNDIPPGAELFAHNRRILAARLKWPAGALEECENIDRMHPGWHTTYRHKFLDNAAGYWSFHNPGSAEPHLHGDTPGEMWLAIETHRCAYRTGF